MNNNKSISFYFFLLFICISSFYFKNSFYSQNLNPIIKLNFNNNIEVISKNKFQIKSNGNIKYSKDRNNNNCSSIYLNGNSYLEILNNKTLENFKTFTVSSWFKIDSSDNYWLSLFCKGDKTQESYNNPQFRAQIFQGNSQSTVSINSIFTKNNLNFQQNLIKPNIWSFITITYDGNSVKTYLNGNLTFTKNYYQGLSINKSNFFIGLDIPGNMEFYKGYLDDFRLFDFALDQNQIYDLYRELPEVQNLNKKKFMEDIKVYTQRNKCGNFVSYKEPTSSCFTYNSKLIKGLETNSFFNVGTTKNIIKYESDEESFICSFNVEVIDNEKPLIICPNDTIIEKLELIKINCPTPLASDNCEIKELINKTFESNSINQFGNFNIEFTANDIYGNTNNCNYNLIYKKIENLYSEDSVTYTKELSFKSDIITLSIYDNSIEDNDTISIIYNNKEIIEKRMVKNKKNGAIILAFDLNKFEKNSFIFKAWNVGNISPNTIKIDFYLGDISNRKKRIKKLKPEKSLILNSKPGNSTALWIKKELK